LRSAPVQLIGDLSYSLYLWHWPLIVAYKAWAGQEADLFAGACLFAASFVLAFFSKRWIEDYFRAPSFAGRTRWRPLQFGAGSIASLVVAGLLLKAIAVPSSTPARNLAEDGEHSLHPGATALMGKPIPANIDFIPMVENARTDLADAYAANCISPSIGRDLRECHYPAPEARSRAIAVGDSHMVQWLPTLQVLAREQGWDLIALTKTGCAFAELDESAMVSEAMKSCAEWNRKALHRIVDAKPDLVIIAQSTGAFTEIAKDPGRGSGEIVRRMASAWREVGGTGARMIALRETPRLGWDAADCLSRPGASIKSCSQSRVKAVPGTSAISLAAAEVPGIRLIDMTDAICAPDECAPVVGNVLVWRDKHHLTATYARTIAPMLSARFAEAGVVPGATPSSPSTPAAAVSGFTKVDPPLVGGIVAFPFAAQVVVNRTVRKRDGGQARQLGMEFLQGDVTTIDRLVAQTFEKAGYARTSATINSASTRSVFQKPSSPGVLVWVRRGAPKGESFKIRSPGARGTIYMAWDVQSRNLEGGNVN
jgi:hypothetical protein